MIQVTFSTIEYEPVCEFYNKNKPSEWSPIERLDRMEGGFSVALKNQDKNVDANLQIKQLRWSRHCLVSHWGYQSLTLEEEKLLYDALVSVYGADQVSITGIMDG